MDPTATLAALRVAHQEEDWPAVAELGIALLEWIDRGGFVPAAPRSMRISRESLKRLQRAVATHPESLQGSPPVGPNQSVSANAMRAYLQGMKDDWTDQDTEDALAPVLDEPILTDHEEEPRYISTEGKPLTRQALEEAVAEADANWRAQYPGPTDRAPKDEQAITWDMLGLTCMLWMEGGPGVPELSYMDELFGADHVAPDGVPVLTRHHVAGWYAKGHYDAQEWAGDVHAAASDNDVDVVDVPEFLRPFLRDA